MNKTRMGKRVASLLLSLVMMLSLLPTAAYATMADGAETQDAIVSGNGTGVSDDSEGSGVTGDQKVEGSNGSNTVGDTAGAEGGADPADSVNGNDSADPQDDGDAVLPAATNVARVGDTEYATLDEAIAALSSSSYTLELLDDTAWDVATPVYWAAGTKSGYAATLADALTAAYMASADAITIVCRPGADVGTLTHGHVADDITIYGNNAYISGGECDLEVDTYTFSRDTGKQVEAGGAYLEKDITVTAYELDNLGVWGQRHTDHKVTVNLTDCDSTDGITVQRVYISGTTGVNDITLTGCDFGTKATSVYSNADGNVVIDNCSFTGAQVPVNFNHKANGTQTVAVQNSTFTNCGDNGDWEQFAAPVRFVNSGSGTMTTTVATCTFTGTVGSNGDILLGDGREGQKSNDVALTVESTEATVQAQQPGYYGSNGTTDASKQGTKNVAAGDKLTTSVTQLMPSETTTYVAEVKGVKYDSLQAAINAAARNATVTMLADTSENVTISTNYLTLDLNGHTLNGGTVAGKPALTVTARVTVKDGSTAQTGTIMREDTAANSGVSSHYVIDVQGAGWLTFESGNVKNNSGNDSGKGASLVRVGDDSIAKYPGLNIKGGTFTQDNFIVIKVDSGDLFLNGGTLNSANSYAVENWHRAAIKGGTVNGTVAAWTYSGGHNSTLTISGGTVNGNVASVSYDKAEGKVAKVSITGGTVNGTLGTYTYGNGLILIEDPAKATIAVTGGTFSSEVDKSLCAKGYIPTKNADGTYGVKEGKYVAEIGSQGYESLTEAVAAAEDGQTVTLLADAAEDVVISKSITLDLGGKTLTNTNGGKATISVTGGTVTVKNGNVVGGTSYYNIEAKKDANLTLTDVTATAGNTGSSMIDNWGTLTITSGTYTGGLNVVKSEEGSVLNISGGTFTLSYATSGYTGVIFAYGDTTISGGEFIQSLTTTGRWNHPTVILTGVVEGYAAITRVTGGHFVNKMSGESIFRGVGKGTSDNFEVSGGTFNKSIPDGYCADGFIPTKNTDGTYGVKEGQYVAKVGSTKYETLADAIRLAAKGKTVKLLADVADCGSLTISKNITLDGGGHTISGNSSISVNMPGNAAADVTIKNVNFKDIANGNKLSAFYFSQVKGKLTITGCTFDSIEYEAIQVTPMEGAEVNVSSNVFKAKADGTQVRHIHIEMAYGSGFDCEGQNIKLTVTDNQLHGTVSGDASMGIWWVGTDSTLKVDGNYMEHPETVSITLSNGGVHYNRGDLIYPARSQADADVDDLIPAVIVADKASGESKIKAYSTLADAVAAAQDGQTVRLLADVEQNTQLTIGKSITLDLNGKTIKNTVDIWGDTANAILSITNGAKVTITGNGIMDAKANDCYTINVVKGDLTIENGTFYGNVSVVQVQEGTLSVKGGTFDLHQKWEGSSKYLFNCIDSEFTSGNAKVAISGGTFVGFDPNVSPEQKVDGKTPSFAAPGVGITKNENGSFTAAAGMTAQILDKDGNSVNAYNTLAEAVAAAQDGQTVRLLADVALDAQIATGKAITIDGQSKYTIKTVKKLASADGKAGMFYRTQSAKGTLTFLNVTLDGGGVSKIFLNEGGAGETVFDGVTSTNGGGIAYGSGIHISGGGSHATIRNSTLTGSTGTMELNNANYYAANDLWVGGNVYVTVENSVIGNVFVNSAPSATATNGVVHGQLTITGEKTKITYLSGEEEAADKLDKFGNNGSLVKIDSGYVEKVFDKGSYAISGGTFKTEVKKEWCAAGYVPTQNADGTYGVEIGKFTVMVTSRTTGSDSPVANVAGGGSDITYAVGTKVTASAISGYKFVGWFVNEYTGTPYSTDLTCKVKPTDDWTMIAVYEPISGGVFALEVSASKFTVNGGATQRSYLLEKMPVGTQVTVVFKGSENFLYWVNESGKVVSTSKTYTFSMGSATTLKAVYAEKEEHQAMVVFISHTQQVISSKGYTDTQEIQFPEPPIKMGATFVRWSMTEAEIRAAMATTTTGIIVVEPVYEFSAGSYTVTVNYPNDETATYTATVGKITTVTAKSIDGKVFKCWKNGDTVLGYTETLKIAPRGDLILTTEYVDAGTTVDRLPVIALTEISASQQGAKYAVSFTATRSVPNGYTVTEQGVLVSTDSRYGEAGALDTMKLDADGVKPDNTQILKATNTDATGVTVLNGIVSAADRTVYGRAYMILRDSSGTMVYVYSDTILSGSYNSLTTNGGN